MRETHSPPRHWFDDLLWDDPNWNLLYSRAEALPAHLVALPESPLRPHFVKARVRVHKYPDGAPGCISRPALYRALQRAGRGDI